MRLGLAAMLCGVPLVACSLGSPTSESESKQATTTSVPVPTRASSRPSDAASPWADALDLRVRAASYKGKKCFGDRPTFVGTPGDDRIRATSGDDVIVTLGGDDVIVGPKGAEWMDSYCTGTGDDQVFYYQGKHTARFFGSIDFNIGLGPGDDSVTVLSRRSQFNQVFAGPGNDTIILGPKSSAQVLPGPGDDLIRRSASRGSRRNEVFGRSGNDLLSGDLGNDRLDGGPGFDSGSGGYHDGRIDWITSVERLRD